jgi:hypothetical protein
MALSDKASAMTQTEESPLLYLNNLNNNTCIICLEEEDNNGIKKGKIVLSSAIPFLQKNCQCHFYIHTDCFNLWFSNKPVCPICSVPYSSDNSIIIIEPPPPVYTELTTYNYAPSNSIASIEDSYKRKIICFFIFLIISYFIFNVISN